MPSGFGVAPNFAPLFAPPMVLASEDGRLGRAVWQLTAMDSTGEHNILNPPKQGVDLGSKTAKARMLRHSPSYALGLQVGASPG